MRLQTLLITLLVVSLMVVGYLTFISNMASTYNKDFDNSTLSELDKDSEIRNITDDLSTSFQEQGLGDEDNIFAMAKVGYYASKMVYRSHTIVHSMLTTTAETLGVPPIIVTILIAILLIAITFTIISAIMQFRV